MENHKKIYLPLIFSLLFCLGLVLAASAENSNFSIQILPASTSPGPVCGNGIIEAGEACDNGAGNGSCPAGCSAGCGYNSCGGGYNPPPSQPPQPQPPQQPETKISFTGIAYYLSQVEILRDGVLVSTTQAGTDARFTYNFDVSTPGTYMYTFIAIDDKGVRSTLFTIPVTIGKSVIVQISNVFIAPSVVLDKIQVLEGDRLQISGQTTPDSDVEIYISSQEIVVHTRTDSSGHYSYSFNTIGMDEGEHFVQIRVTYQGETSSYSEKIRFFVGNKNILQQPQGTCSKSDLNGDCRVNLTDFSIEAYWFEKSNPPAKYDFNNDGQVDISDFSIMAYYWTG